MNTVANPAPGFRNHPAHRVDVRALDRRVVVELDGVTIADSDRAFEVHETGHAPVIYFPPGHVRTDLLRSSATRTHCPFKGDADPWSATSRSMANG